MDTSATQLMLGELLKLKGHLQQAASQVMLIRRAYPAVRTKFSVDRELRYTETLIAQVKAGEV